jgi:Ca2+-binding RTX toxin-like protein
VSRLASRLVIAAVIALAATAPAHAAWEAPQRIDQTSEGFGNSGAGDVAVGDNGLATILFLQSDDAGAKLWATRRGASDASWLAPLGPVTAPTGAFTIDAAPDGSTGGAYRVDEDDPGTPAPGDESTLHHVTGLGWAADQSATVPKTATLGDEAGEQAPPVDADGRGFGWTAFVDGDMNLQIVRFGLADPSKTPTTFTVAPTELDPAGNQNLNETLSRSNPRVDANADGDVIVSFVEEERVAECCAQPHEQTVVYAVRKLQGQTGFTDKQLISHPDDTEPVTQHDPAIAENGDATIIFAGGQDRNTAEPTTEGPKRVYARRWLATSGEPRPAGSIEFVSSSADDAPTVSQLRAEAAGTGANVTAAWVQGSAQLNSAERSTAWTKPQTLSSSAASYDITVDVDGVATAVYRESTNIKARRRAAGQQWTDAETLNTAPSPTDSAPPRVDAGIKDQADAYLVQTDGGRRAAFATRFTGVAPVEPVEPPLQNTEDCPADVDNVQIGDAGANSIQGADGRDTFLGGDGNDTLSGAGGNDCLRGQGGDDTVSGQAGDDTVGGGDGNDRVTGGDGADRLTGDAGTDSMNGDAGDDIGTGGDGNDTLDGSAGNDTLNGEAGDDKVRGGAGSDLLGGADGNDTLSGGAGRNVLFAGLGDDVVFGGPQRDTVVGEAGNDTVSSGKGNDNINGGDGNDKLRGGSGANTIDGAGGNDTLKGGSGKDKLLGSAGRDTLRGLGGADNLSGGDGRDKLSGGGGNDRISAVDRKRDRVSCGPGKDRVTADKVDRVAKSCEKVRRAK